MIKFLLIFSSLFIIFIDILMYSLMRVNVVVAWLLPIFIFEVVFVVFVKFFNDRRMLK